jgi:hypothetical protein
MFKDFEIPFDLKLLDPLECERLKKLHSASVSVVKMALNLIPLDVEGFEYHNLRHSADDVIGSVLEIGPIAVERGKMSIEGFYDLFLGMGTHDVFYDKNNVGTDINESKSTDKTYSFMEFFPVFTKKNFQRVRDIHRATVFRGAGKLGIVQSAPPGDYVAQLATDIDTGAIGMSWDKAKLRINGFYTETTSKQPDLKDKQYLDFLHFQIDVLSGHEYKTPEAKEHYRHLAENVKEIKKLISSAKAIN